MTTQKLITLALAGATLMAVSEARAQQTAYSDGDLLLNFRTTTSQTPPNVTVDLGNVNSFLSTVGALSGGTAVLNISGSTPGYTTQFSASALLAQLGAPSSANPLGMSAVATTSASDTLWLTRVITGPSATGSGLTPSAKQSSAAQSAPAADIGFIGLGYNNGTQLGSGNAATVSAGNVDSYYSQTVDGSGQIDFNATETITSGAGGPIEGVQSGSGNVYEALWEVPPTVSRSNPGQPDIYEGYFTFQPSGEVDFTVSAVPEPSTYLLLVMTGLFGLVFRRQVRSLIA